MCAFLHSKKDYSTRQSISINDDKGETTYDYQQRTDEGEKVYHMSLF